MLILSRTSNFLQHKFLVASIYFFNSLKETVVYYKTVQSLCWGGTGFGGGGGFDLFFS